MLARGWGGVTRGEAVLGDKTRQKGLSGVPPGIIDVVIGRFGAVVMEESGGLLLAAQQRKWKASADSSAISQRLAWTYKVR